jgi:hypothetical protein
MESMARENVILIHNRILVSLKKGHSAILDMGEPGKFCIKYERPGREKQIASNLTYTWSLIKVELIEAGGRMMVGRDGVGVRR